MIVKKKMCKFSLEEEGRYLVIAKWNVMPIDFCLKEIIENV